MPTTRRRTAIAIAVIGLLAVVTFGLNLRTTSQQFHASVAAANSTEFQQIENLADQPLRVLENDDSPLRIVDAKVKEIPGSDFTKLTGKATNLPLVCSVPSVQLLNSSPQTIKGFVLAVRDPISKTTRAVIQSKVSIAQGETYTLPRQAFIEPEWTSTVQPDGQIKANLNRPDINSEKYWIPFAGRSDLFVSVARVSFQDGSIWRLKEGGDIR